MFFQNTDFFLNLRPVHTYDKIFTMDLCKYLSYDQTQFLNAGSTLP